MSSAAATVAVA